MVRVMFVDISDLVMQESKNWSPKVGDEAYVAGRDNNGDLKVTKVYVVKIGTSYVYVSLNNTVLAFGKHSGFLKGMSYGPFLCSGESDIVRRVKATDTIQAYLSQYNAFSRMPVESLECIAHIMREQPLDPRIGDQPYNPRYRESNASAQV